MTRLVIGHRAGSRLIALLLLLVLASACAAPIGVTRVKPSVAQKDASRSILTSGELSEKSRILLRRLNRENEWKDDPAAVLAYIQSLLAIRVNEFNAEQRASLLDSVAELAFVHALDTGDRGGIAS